MKRYLLVYNKRKGYSYSSQVEALENLREDFTSSNYDAKIETVIKKKQEVDRKMVEMGEAMKMLTLHSSSRVRLGLKKSEAQTKTAAYDARCSFCLFVTTISLTYCHIRFDAKQGDIKKLVVQFSNLREAKTKLQLLLGYVI
jgi:hypothetical protein